MQTKINEALQWQMKSGRSQLFQIQISVDPQQPAYDFNQVSGLEIFESRPDKIRARATREAINALNALDQVTSIDRPDRD